MNRITRLLGPNLSAVLRHSFARKLKADTASPQLSKILSQTTSGLTIEDYEETISKRPSIQGDNFNSHKYSAENNSEHYVKDKKKQNKNNFYKFQGDEEETISAPTGSKYVNKNAGSNRNSNDSFDEEPVTYLKNDRTSNYDNRKTEHGERRANFGDRDRNDYNPRNRERSDYNPRDRDGDRGQSRNSRDGQDFDRNRGGYRRDDRRDSRDGDYQSRRRYGDNDEGRDRQMNRRRDNYGDRDGGYRDRRNSYDSQSRPDQRGDRDRDRNRSYNRDRNDRDFRGNRENRYDDNRDSRNNRGPSQYRDRSGNEGQYNRDRQDIRRLDENDFGRNSNRKTDSRRDRYREGDIENEEQTQGNRRQMFRDPQFNQPDRKKGKNGERDGRVRFSFAETLDLGKEEEVSEDDTENTQATRNDSQSVKEDSDESKHQQ